MYGYIYRTTNTVTGKFYIGKKAYLHRTKVKLSKKQRKLTGKRIKYVEKSSGWENYYGSSDELQKDIEKYGKDKFIVTKLKECEDRVSLAYWEQHYQFTLSVLFCNTYNGNIGGKFYRNKIKT